MHKLNSASTAPGATLLRKLHQGTFAKFHEATDAPAAQRPAGGLYAPLFAFRKAAQPVPTAGKKPSTLNVAPPTMKAPGEALAHGDDSHDDDPAHTHNRHLRETAAAHAALLASFKAVYAGPSVNPSKGPVGL